MECVPFHPGHLDGIVALCEAEGWPSYIEDRQKTLRVLTAPGVTTVVAIDGPDVIGFAYVQSDGEIQQVTFDCAEPAVLAEFWAAVLGYPPPDIEGTHGVLKALGQAESELGNWYRIEDPSGSGPRLAFQRVPEPSCEEPPASRKPLGAELAALDVEEDRIVALGASNCAE